MLKPNRSTLIFRHFIGADPNPQNNFIQPALNLFALGMTVPAKVVNIAKSQDRCAMCAFHID